jgi:hypothetical protein
MMAAEWREATKVGGSKLVTTERSRGDGKKTYKVERVSPNGVLRLFRSGEDPVRLLELPHREGQRWKTRMGVGEFEINGTMTAGPVERVEVPLGAVLAVRIDWEFTINGTAQKSTAWYAHGIGVGQEDSWKLKSFTPGKE